MGAQITTISEFLLQAGTEYRVFDLGRGIRKIAAQDFLDMENARKPAPCPRQQHGWFGLVFWNKQLSEQQYIWFIKLPLDEQGLIMPAGRDQFMHIIVEALGAQLEHTEQKNGQLPENPFTFIPTQQQLADFNSISRVRLGLPASQHFNAALSYVQAPAQGNWHELAVQGLADVAARIGDEEVLAALCDNLPSLPATVRKSLLTSLENQPVPVRLAEVITHLLNASPNDGALWSEGLRALAQSPCTGLVAQQIDAVLEGELARSLDVLIVIAGRLWHHLDNTRLMRFLDAVAQLNQTTPGLFHGVYADLVQLPDLRAAMLGVLRDPNRSQVLSAAIGELFSEAGQ
ncbi:DUF3549 family protein [Aestuariibacter halophilus]|uniref:DUF3549 family protein n=1 Tax=Fluctibacter halophilus TaxID=226011 RepID=A0ABS8GC71_9ALTE|nr:DUF3549 family protein [Aestuariibacter halophilus]MCC2618155.1 DUF3549 family protein [Aestuariibacter halophilus]